MHSSRKKSRGSKHNKTPEKINSPVPEGLTYAEAQRMVEFDIGSGRSQRLSIFEPIEVVPLVGNTVFILSYHDTKFFRKNTRQWFHQGAVWMTFLRPSSLESGRSISRTHQNHSLH
jgi:hypothetical protein